MPQTNRVILHILCGIATPDIRRTTIAEIERYKCNQDPRLPLYGYVATEKCFESRQSFMHSTEGDSLITKQERQNMWKERNIVRVNEPIWKRTIESLPPGQNLKCETWKTLNRLRVGDKKRNLS